MSYNPNIECIIGVDDKPHYYDHTKGKKGRIVKAPKNAEFYPCRDSANKLKQDFALERKFFNDNEINYNKWLKHLYIPEKRLAKLLVQKENTERLNEILEKMIEDDACSETLKTRYEDLKESKKQLEEEIQQLQTEIREHKKERKTVQDMHKKLEVIKQLFNKYLQEKDEKTKLAQIDRIRSNIVDVIKQYGGVLEDYETNYLEKIFSNFEQNQVLTKALQLIFEYTTPEHRKELIDGYNKEQNKIYMFKFILLAADMILEKDNARVDTKDVNFQLKN